MQKRRFHRVCIPRCHDFGGARKYEEIIEFDSDVPMKLYGTTLHRAYDGEKDDMILMNAYTPRYHQVIDLRRQILKPKCKHNSGGYRKSP